MTVQFGGGEAKVLPFQSCNLNGCLAEYLISEGEIASLSKGANLILAVQTMGQAPITFNMPGAGFAAAYAKVKGQ